MASEMKLRIAAVINEHRHIQEPTAVARLVLEALREPTDDMIAIAESFVDFVLPDCMDNSLDGRRNELRDAWRKAVDVALYPPIGRKQDFQNANEST